MRTKGEGREDMERNGKRVLVAMSGGVDSSAAAWLLREQGYECIGVTMKLLGNQAAGLDQGRPCCTLDDVEDARSVAARMGIRHYVFNFSDDFEEKVIRPFVDAYERGETPNPCIDCNRFLKFDRLHRRARELGCGYIATGHYAQIVEDGADGFHVRRPADKGSGDEVKDKKLGVVGERQAVVHGAISEIIAIEVGRSACGRYEVDIGRQCRGNGGVVGYILYHTRIGHLDGCSFRSFAVYVDVVGSAGCLGDCDGAFRYEGVAHGIVLTHAFYV